MTSLLEEISSGVGGQHYLVGEKDSLPNLIYIVNIKQSRTEIRMLIIKMAPLDHIEMCFLKY